MGRYPWPVALVAGFCTAILGVTGFESSANFIEEQKKGVYPKSVRARQRYTYIYIYIYTHTHTHTSRKQGTWGGDKMEQ